MKNLLILIALATLIVTNSKAHAISFSVIGPCSESPSFSGTFDVTDLKVSVGKNSVEIFNQQKIPFAGDESGFSSILNTPTGLDSIEVISDTQMRAYGWCYTVNGVSPDVLAGDYLFKSNADQLVWFYAYSTYDKGAWLDYCVPSYKIKAAQFCSK